MHGVILWPKLGGKPQQQFGHREYGSDLILLILTIFDYHCRREGKGAFKVDTLASRPKLPPRIERPEPYIID